MMNKVDRFNWRNEAGSLFQGLGDERSVILREEDGDDQEAEQRSGDGEAGWAVVRILCVRERI